MTKNASKTTAKKPAAKKSEPAAAKSSEGVTASAGNAATETSADLSVDPSKAGTGESAKDAPPASSPAGTNSTDDPERKSDGGAGHSPAGPAAGLGNMSLADLEQLAARDPDGFAELEKRVDAAESEFRSKYPKFSAAVFAWHATGREDQPSALRIVSKHDGFRRAGMPHSRQPAEHPIEKFSGPEQLEALFAEPNLTVELI